MSDKLLELSFDVETIADTLQAYVSLFHGNTDRPNDTAIGNGIYGLVKRLYRAASDLGQMSAAANRYGRNDNGKEARTV